jgi:hypothetical protein
MKPGAERIRIGVEGRTSKNLDGLWQKRPGHAGFDVELAQSRTRD